MLDWRSSPTWTGDHKSVLLSEKIAPVADVTLTELIEKSEHFPVKFPIESVRCYQLKTKTSSKTLERNINSTYPVIHEYALYLCVIFLLHKRKLGPKSDFYKNMSLIELIDRLLSRRAVCFLERKDDYLLLSGKTGSGGWEKIGTLEETPPLTLDNCLSYDEIKLSALLSVSSYSYFINDGDRFNNGIFEEERRKIEENGVIVGLIGTRLEKPKVMEYREIIKSRQQNNDEAVVPSVQNEFLKFYGDTNQTYEQLVEQNEFSKDRYVEIKPGEYFDKLMYEKRIAISIDTLLLEANDRAKKEDKRAFVHVVGLGLGVWNIYQGQNKLFMDTFAQRLELLSTVLTNVSDVRFSHIRETVAGWYKNGDSINGIKLHMVNKNPQEKLTGEDEGKLLVVSYAWDGNAFPGNEFWLGSLSGSGDPAAASSSQVAELHNWYINRKVSARNLRVATFQGLVTFQEYQQLHTDD